jgi:hypothetical protein
MQLKSSICQAKGWFQKTQEFLNDLEKGFWSGKIERGVYCQAKGWFQKTQEFSNDLKKGFWSGKMEGEKIDSHEKVLKMFSPLKMLNSPFSKERDFLSFSSFISLFYAPSLYWGWTQRFLKCLWRKKFKLSFKWDGSGYTKIYEIGGAAKKLLMVDAYPWMDLCMPINFGWG